MQPLDVGYFPGLTAVLKKQNVSARGVVLESGLAQIVHGFNLKLASDAALNPPGAIVNTWRHCGLSPFIADIDEIFSDDDFAKSDRSLGISATSPACVAAKKFDPSQLSIIADSAAAAALPEVVEVLSAHINKSGFDLNMVAPTDDNVVAAKLEKLAASRAEAELVAEKRAERQAKKLENQQAAALKKLKQQEKKEIKERVLADKAAAQEAARVAAENAAMAQGAPAADPTAVGAPKSNKRGQKRPKAEGGIATDATGANPYARGFKKRRM